jgi:ribosomal protein L11
MCLSDFERTRYSQVKPDTNNQLGVIHVKIGMVLDSYVHFTYTSSTTESLKEHLGITTGGWKALLAGKREITLSELIKLAAWFKTDLKSILTANF